MTYQLQRVVSRSLIDVLVIIGCTGSQINQEEKTIQGVDGSDNISLLQTETCSITLTAKQLLEIVDGTLQVQLLHDVHMCLAI